MPKLYHAVTKYATMTFLMEDERDDYMSDIDDRSGTAGDDAILCESEVPGDDYDKATRWREEA